jgi:hypothetical protein
MLVTEFNYANETETANKKVVKAKISPLSKSKISQLVLTFS